MKKFSTHLYLLAFASLLLSSARAQDGPEKEGEQEQKVSIIHLKDGMKRESSLLGRSRDGHISLNSEDGLGRMVFAPASIRFIEFPIEIDRRKVEQLQDMDRYSELADMIKTATEEWIYYLDVPNNINEWVLSLLHSLYSAGRFEEALDLADRIERRGYSKTMRMEARLFRVLVELETEPDDGLASAQKLEEVDAGDRLAPIYWYVRIKESVLRNDWDTAIRTASVMVANVAKDFDWLPIGLYWSLKGQLACAKPEVADLVLKEMKLQFGNGRWTRKAEEVVRAYPRFLRAEDSLGAIGDARYEGNPARGETGFDSRSASAVGFDGSDDALLVNLPDKIQRFSIVFWFLGENKNCGLLSVLDADGANIGDVHLEHSNLHSYIAEESHLQSKGQHYADGRWHQIAYVFGASEQILYADGSEVGRSALAGKGLPAPAGIRIGFSGMAKDSFFEGRLDNIDIYSTPLAAEDVAQIFNRGQGGVRLENLLAVFDLEDQPLETILSYEPEIEDPVPSQQEVDSEEKENENRKGKNDDES